jgi:hypothetical protein
MFSVSWAEEGGGIRTDSVLDQEAASRENQQEGKLTKSTPSIATCLQNCGFNTDRYDRNIHTPLTRPTWLL